MMHDNILIVAVVVAMATATASRVPNKCPQPTKSNPTPPPMYYAHPEYCTKFVQCGNGIAYEMDCFRGTVYNKYYDTCVHPGSEHDICTPQNPRRECQRDTTNFIPHPDHCARYYNCSDTSPRSGYRFVSRFAPFENECPFPEVFDIRLKKCVHYEGAVCGQGRAIAKWKCDYLANQCSQCTPCYVYNPSCIRLADGVWADKVRIWTPTFIECKDERYQKSDTCPRHPMIDMVQLFHPERRSCVPLWEIPQNHSGYEPSCEDKEPGHYTIEGMDVIAYQCPEKKYFLCQPPLQVHNDISQCTPL